MDFETSGEGRLVGKTDPCFEINVRRVLVWEKRRMFSRDCVWFGWECVHFGFGLAFSDVVKTLS